MSTNLNIKINDSAYKKLLNLMERKRYPNLGDLIAYLVREENKRIEEQRKKDNGKL